MELRPILVKPVSLIDQIFHHLRQSVDSKRQGYPYSLPYPVEYMKGLACKHNDEPRNVYLVKPREWLNQKNQSLIFAPMSLLLGLCAHEEKLREQLGEWFQVSTYPYPNTHNEPLQVGTDGRHWLPYIYYDKRAPGTHLGGDLYTSERDFEFTLQMTTYEEGVFENFRRSIADDCGCPGYFALVKLWEERPPKS